MSWRFLYERPCIHPLLYELRTALAYSLLARHVEDSEGAVETLTDGLGVEVPLSLLKAVTETATPVVSRAERATCVHVFLVHNLIWDWSIMNSPEIEIAMPSNSIRIRGHSCNSVTTNAVTLLV